MTLKERIKVLANKRNISLPALEAELGFDVSMDYLLNGTEAPMLTDIDERDIAKDLDNIMRKLASKEDGPASFDGQELSAESAELFREELEIALRRLKLINKEKYNPNKNKK